LEASISQLDTTHGKLFTVILRDVSERMRAQEELRAFAVQAHHVREEEKARVARELHDELAQSLTTLKMDAAWMRDRLASEAASHLDLTGKLATMQATLDHAVAATRRIASDLRPLILDDLGLAAALEWLVNGFIKRSGMACALEIDGEVELPEPYATAVFRIVQESLNNVAKHAGASKVLVRLAHDSHALTLSIRDDGRGFDAQAPRRPEALGLAGLRERAHLLRGTADIRSQAGTGTSVEVRIPLG
jgi:signal transduction histidine kinase